MIRSLKTLLSAATLATLAAAPATAETYAIDAVHSTVLGRTMHMGTSRAYVRFNEIAGTVTFDEKDAAKNALDVTVKTDSLDSANDKRDQHLKGPDFFNVKQFPTMTFKSKSVKSAGAKKYKAEGDMTLLGVTKPVSFEFEKTGEGKDRGGKAIIGGEATFTFKWSDFAGKDPMKGIGDETAVIVSIEAAAK